MITNLPNQIFSGYYREGHVQGIAVDQTHGYLYYSFTTMLLKTDLQGNPIGSVINLAGHLGCITIDPDGSLLYGSLELKHDAIGEGIINRIGRDPTAEDAFYLVLFDLSKIDRMDMDAERDGVMRAVYLRDVACDYKSIDESSGKEHRYGCSGIDGIGYGPVFGMARNGEKKLMVAYGVYEDLTRCDNDHQVILQYDKSVLARHAMPLNQSDPHHSGPECCEARYFFYTGNTRYGIQNLEYDPASHLWFAAVYVGHKSEFPNYPMFVIDGASKPIRRPLIGRGDECGAVLSHAGLGQRCERSGIFGSRFPYGQTGIASLGDGSFYISHPDRKVEEKAFAPWL